MSYFPRYDKGDWKALCDICGREFKATSLRKRWDGFMTCSEDWETRHPQDFVRGVADVQAPTWTRPEPSDTFVAATTSSSIAMFAIAGAMIAGNTSSPGLVPPGTFTP